MPEPDKLLVFCGAGFSKALTDYSTNHLPVSNRILSDPHYTKYISRVKVSSGMQFALSQHLDPLSSLLAEDFHAVFEVYTYPDGTTSKNRIWLDPVSREPVNFEVLYAYCDLQSKNPLLSDIDRMKYRYALVQLQMLLSYILDVRNTEVHANMDLLEGLLKKLMVDADNSYVPLFITTNFDNLLEDGLRITTSADFKRTKSLKSLVSVGIGEELEVDRVFSVNNAPFGGPLLVKLHGGINYFICTNSTCRYSSGPHYSWGMFPMKSPCPECGSYTVPGILPPTVLKNYSSSSYYTKWIRFTVSALHKTDHVIFIGYSFPSYDAMLTTWVSYGLRANKDLNRITIIDKHSYPRVKRLMSAIRPDLETKKRIRVHKSIEAFVKYGKA